MSKRVHYEYLTGLRALAIVAVVGIHALSNIVNQSQVVTWQWQVASILNLSLRWAVPVFIMMSGALLLSKKAESNKVFVTKRLQRLLIPAVVWVGVYFVWFNRGGYVVMVSDYLERVLVWGNPYYHFYFLYVMFGLYILTPGLRALVAGMSDRALGVTIVVLLAMSAYWSYSISWFQGVFPRDTLMVVTHFLPYVGYYLAGYFLHVRLEWKRWGWLLVSAVALLCLAVIYTTHWFAQNGYWSKSMMMEDYASVNVVIAAVLVFAGVKWWYVRTGFGNKGWIKSLAAAALGIYLIHVIVLEEAVKWLKGFGVEGWGVVVGVFVVGLGVSWVLAEGIGRVPGVRRVVGR